MAQNNTISAAVINEKNEYFKKLAASSDRSCDVPYIVRTIAEVGAENIFYVSKDYRGLYEDDFCDLVYWNNLTGEVIYDHWATNFAAPSLRLYTDNVIKFYEAVEAGMVNMELIKNLNIEKIHNHINSISFNNRLYDETEMKIKKTIESTYPLIKVERGRKWRGTGYFIEKIVISSPYGDREMAKVLSLDDFQIHYCNYYYVEFVELNTIIEEYKAYANAYVDNAVKNNTLGYIFDNMNCFTWKFKYDHMMSIFDFIKSKENNISYLVNSAYDPIEEERKRKASENRAANFKNIIEWVKNNTDKTSEKDIHELALRILSKRY